MAAASQASTLNQQALFEDQEVPAQMAGFFSFPAHLTYPQLGSCHQSFKGFIIPPSLAADAPTTTSLAETLPVLSSATHNKQREGTIASDLGGPHLLSLAKISCKSLGMGRGKRVPEQKKEWLRRGSSRAVNNKDEED
ncbi:hypothetical protein OIU74_005223 [Salix koriyanagi]|uniref:Uncharacterized protein n=1 Tax=Salix koriyanagi TaxID=2511006 RepID=A0A9Q0ZGD4_9ROSI|nr:hypothetical protein OIU74_005223 [Salix koriyanagi]